MLRHERQTVAMELAAALHHSRDVGPEVDGGLRAQTTASSGGRPGVLLEAEPQGGAVTVGYVAAPGPLLEVSSMAGCDSVDGTALLFLVKKALERQKEEEKKRKEEEMQDILRRFRADLPISDAEWEAWQAWRGIASSASGQKRKRKKRRKKKTPRTSSHLTLPRARRRQWQWHSHFAGFPGDVLLSAAFPSMPCIMACMTRRTRM